MREYKGEEVEKRNIFIVFMGKNIILKKKGEGQKYHILDKYIPLYV